SFVAVFVLEGFGLVGQNTIMTGLPLVGVLLVALAACMLVTGAIGVGIERFLLRPLRSVKGPAAMILTIGVSYVLLNIVILGVGADSKNFPNPLPPVAF